MVYSHESMGRDTGCKKMKLLMIDVGHGGSEPGAVAHGYIEKELNLVVAKRVAELLKEYTPDIIRTSDVYLSLNARGNRIRNKYKYCLSIHFNAGGGRGIETIHSMYSQEGKKLAHAIAESLKESIGLPIRKVYTRASPKGGDYYAMHTKTGSTTTVIVESLFMDAQEDLRALNIEKIANGIANGFKSFLGGGVRSEHRKISITGKTDYPTLKRGDKGQYVVVLQEQLQDMGYYIGAIDGDFGPATDRAVKLLQEVNGLAVDGIVGPATWENILIAHVYEVDPMKLRNEIVKSPGNQIQGDFINSVFFNPDMTSSSYMINDGKLLNRQWVTNPYTGKPHDNVKRANLIVYQDGSVAIKMIMDMEKEEDISKIKFAVTGFNLDPLNLSAEWWPADVARTAWRSMLGYDGKKIKAVIMANCSAERGNKVLGKLGCNLRLGLDSGGSTCGRFAGETIHTTARRIYGIIRFD